MLSELPAISVWGYGLAAIAYLVFAVYLAFAWRGRVAGGALLAAVAASALWAAVDALLAAAPNRWVMQLSAVIEVLRGASWFAFLVILLLPLGAGRLRWPLFVAVGAVLLQLGAVVLAGLEILPTSRSAAAMLGAFLGGAILGLVLVEQIYRGVPGAWRWALKPLCLGLAAGYMFELYFYADGYLFGRLDADLWGVRGIVHALVIPLIAVSAARNPSWTVHISVSRAMVFHSTALAVSGLYLLVIAAAGYYLRYVGGDWGRALQTALLFAGLLLLGVFAFSRSQRARLRVFLDKHLFPYRYDYRKEWLRFTAALAAEDSTLDLGQSVVKALSDLVESPGGSVWLPDGAGGLAMRARLNTPASDIVEPEESPFCRYLREREWIVNLDEYRARPAHYADLALPRWLSALPDAWLVIPLKTNGALVGFVVLNSPRTAFEVNWEVLDLLKTAQRQAASYLARMQATEALLEARKFDSFNRMAAFVVHDLKNLVAQLALMLKNAERHKNNPAFQRDMLDTVAHVEERMRALMRQLQEKRSIDPARPVDLAAIVARVRDTKRQQLPPVACEVAPHRPIEVMAHPDRLERVIGHLVQNALDATPAEGRVTVRLTCRDTSTAALEVVDTGCGMSDQFIRDQLSRPFHSTKPSGMGLGVYETNQYLHELGGTMRYESVEGHGTRVTLVLPLTPRSVAAVAGEEEAETEKHE